MFYKIRNLIRGDTYSGISLDVESSKNAVPVNTDGLDIRTTHADFENEKFIERLKALCLEFDRAAGTYPEHALEGKAVYMFAANLKNEDGIEWDWDVDK
jgi:hypothetical protein